MCPWSGAGPGAHWRFLAVAGRDSAAGAGRSRQSRARRADDVHEQDLLLVTEACFITLIIGVAASLILIVLGGFFNRKIEL
jgi:hypothetical protein